MSNLFKKNKIFTSLGGGGGAGTVLSVNSGTDITVDNTDPANPIINFTGTYQQPITVVANFAALPAAGTVTGKFYWASTSQGTKFIGVLWGGTYYPVGLYYSNGVTWEYIDTPAQATQAEVDAGVVTDKFVTPETHFNSSKWATKQDVLTNSAGLAAALNDETGTDKAVFNTSPTVITPQIDTYYQMSNAATPATPTAGNVRFWVSTTNGIENGNWIGSDGLPMRMNRDLVSTVRNTSGAPLVAGDIVYTTGATGTAPNVAKAKADSITTMQAIGIVMETIANNAYGRIQRFGRTEFTLDTSGFSVNDILYLSESTAGTLTNIRPIHPNFNQQIGVVIVSSVGNGSIFITINDPQGFELGTNQNTFAIGDGTAGIITTSFVNDFTGQLQWNPTAARTLTLPDTTDTLIGKNTTDTLTNKRNTKRTVTVAVPGATPTINSDNCDIAAFTGLNANITSMTTNLSGTPVSGDLLSIELTDNGTARAITWGASFVASGFLELPTTTAISTVLKCLFQWNNTTNKWVIVAIV